MYSIASWSPSQSEPLIVSYMCQIQWSSLMLPSAAGTLSRARRPKARPPRVAARRACPNRRRRRPVRRTCEQEGSSLRAPQDLDRPAQIGDQQRDRRPLYREANAGRLHVIHVDLARADPGVIEQRDHEQEACERERRVREQRLPQRVIDAAGDERNADQQQRVERHQDRGHALCEPVEQAVVRADDFATRHHSFTAAISVNARLNASTITLDWRAGASSMPLFRSSSRCRMPAKK